MFVFSKVVQSGYLEVIKLEENFSLGIATQELLVGVYVAHLVTFVLFSMS